MKKRLLVSDFDGTIFKPDAPKITEKNFQAIRRWRQAGHFFVVATMRCLRSLQRDFPDLGTYADYLILDGGAVIYRGEDKIMEKWLKTDDVKMLEQMARRYGWDDHEVNLVYFKRGDEFPELTGPLEITKIRVWFRERSDCEQFSRELSKIADRQGKSCEFKTYTYCDIEHIHDSYLPWIDRDFHHCVEVSPRAASKSSGVTRVIKDLIDRRTAGKVDYSEIPRPIAIGDSDADISMLEQAISFTVDGASEGALRAADYVVPEFSDLVERFLEADSPP